jgi:hypothetical protein
MKVGKRMGFFSAKEDHPPAALNSTKVLNRRALPRPSIYGQIFYRFGLVDGLNVVIDGVCAMARCLQTEP